MIDNDPILWTMLNAIKEQNAQITATEQGDERARSTQLKEQDEKISAAPRAEPGDRRTEAQSYGVLQAAVVLQSRDRKKSCRSARVSAGALAELALDRPLDVGHSHCGSRKTDQ